jgi:hypothetical protein
MTVGSRWRFYVNIRFSVALNLAEGANVVCGVTGVMNTMLVIQECCELGLSASERCVLCLALFIMVYARAGYPRILDILLQ